MIFFLNHAIILLYHISYLTVKIIPPSGDRFPAHEKVVDVADRLGLLRYDFREPIRAFLIAEELLVGHGHLTVCKALPLAPCSGFILCL